MLSDLRSPMTPSLPTVHCTRYLLPHLVLTVLHGDLGQHQDGEVQLEHHPRLAGGHARLQNLDTGRQNAYFIEVR